ncbi:MAG: hypothetical protein DWQ49_09870 [Bacteroidetes bacterium]|nr:MAG: hypothetical protein DWQ49_09870 [Bacteroidota bacterium]
MDKYADTLEVINKMAMVKMAMNNHKGKIEDLKSEMIISMMTSEIDELKEAVSNENILEIIEEAADIMNFLVGLIYKQIKLYRIRKDD